jgi:hypothetical protein
MYISEDYMRLAVGLMRGVGYRGSDSHLGDEVVPRLRADPSFIERLRAKILGRETTTADVVRRLTAEREQAEAIPRRAAERASDVDECIRHERKIDAGIDERTAYVRAHRNMQSDPRHYSKLFEEEERKAAEEERRAAERAATPEGRREARRRHVARFRAAQADERVARHRGGRLFDQLVLEEMWAAGGRIDYAEAARRAGLRLDRDPQLIENAVRDLTRREDSRAEEAARDARLAGDGPLRSDRRHPGDPKTWPRG